MNVIEVASVTIEDWNKWKIGDWSVIKDVNDLDSPEI